MITIFDRDLKEFFLKIIVQKNSLETFENLRNPCNNIFQSQND